MNSIDGNIFVKQSKNVYKYFSNDFAYISRIRFDGNEYGSNTTCDVGLKYRDINVF